MKKLVLLCLFYCFAITMSAQYKQITYSHNLLFEYPQAGHITETKYIFKETQGMSLNNFNNYSLYINKPKEHQIFIPITLFDKKKKSYKELLLISDTLNNEYSLHYIYNKWSPMSDYFENFELLEQKESDSSKTKRKLTIKKTNETQVINGYECKLFIVSEYGKEYNAWCTKEINYNWLFKNFIYELPGTVVKIYRNDNIVLELKNIEEMKYHEIVFPAEFMIQILSEWENK